MKSILAAAIAAAVLIASPVRASEITFKLDDSTQNAIGQLPTLLDSCVAGMTMRADASVCRSISQFLQSVATEVKNTQVAQAKAEAAKAEAAKAAAAAPAPDAPAVPPQ